MNSKWITCSKGDITESRAEAIVNAANNHLWMGSGVAGAIKRKGGVEIETEAVSKGPVDIGEAVATGAGRLPQKYVIHAAAMGQDLRTDEEKIRRATRNSLLRAEELKLESIDFPALGTGVGGFPPEKAAEVMIDEAGKFLRVSRFLEHVGFVLFDNETFECFKSELGAESASV
jgi:O-acetyl-ADP-ribose deacetylase (regulator of RNase III)